MPIKVNRVYPKQAKVSNPFNTYNTIPWWSRDAFGLFIKCFVVLLKYSSLYHMLRNPLPNVGLSHYSSTLWMSSVILAWNLRAGMVDTEPKRFFHNNTLCGYHSSHFTSFQTWVKGKLMIYIYIYIYFTTQENAIKVVWRTCIAFTSFLLLAWELISCLLR